MHDTDLFHEHLALTDEERAEIAQYIWDQEHVDLTTIGIDIGSSTSHLLFAKVLLERQTQGLSSRFTVVHRQVLWRSPIMLTPFLPDGTIDAAALGAFIQKAYGEAGFARQDIDSGAVILTGEAIKKKNAQAIDELFAAEAGKFVCATAGHKLECTLAAHGAGAVRLSKERDECVLHVDIGGGTTKLALIDRGVIIGVAAFAVGGRLLATDEGGVWTRVDDSARLVAQELGLATDPATLADVAVRRKIAQRLAAIAADYILDAPRDALGRTLLLTEDLARPVTPVAITFSGGVSEYVFGYEEREYGDIAKLLAAALGEELKRRGSPVVIDPGQRIRATVIGASQFTVQVSGKTIYLPDPGVLPVHNVPVVQAGLDLAGAFDPAVLTAAIGASLRRMDLAPDSRMAIAFAWHGDPDYGRIAAAGRAIVAAVAPDGRRSQPLLLMIDGDVGRTFGQFLRNELGLTGDLVSIDGVQLAELDFVDVGELISPPGVVPVVIKSLLFS
ncbi:MAG TPA: ethanolamine ammonia-lyase reactivating factor EutA [Steroidobacteraceae bacterium]